jgi:hypothetical protein
MKPEFSRLQKTQYFGRSKEEEEEEEKNKKKVP